MDDDEDYDGEPKDYSDEELEEDIGEEEEKQKDPLANIYEHYEPSELEQKHFTSEDEKIRQLDVPERLQVLSFICFLFLPSLYSPLPTLTCTFF